ncbi:hypothetical protein [Leifsonia sp. Leaf264]|uniref:hypothetical protein n=1 Tax=Leifsonia sp. Leaf264 TaxID=1736314 RepID=UPI0006FC9EB2|nr:hypothetical protein [Leifsonia sp. Leaf264]KQO98537.1 hypothetical protein ASF30_10775 [Leifsonia sp. Leaf264]
MSSWDIEYGTRSPWAVWEEYAIEPPDDHAQPIVKIPVTGPAPFNTLAVVRGRAIVGDGFVSNDRPKPERRLVSTHLKIPDYDMERPWQEQLQHSTTASLFHLSQTDQTGSTDAGAHFIAAIDSIVFEPVINEDTGRLSINIDTNKLGDQVTAIHFLEMTSWVLYFDPKTVKPGTPKPREHPPVRTGRGEGTGGQIGLDNIGG